MNAAQARAALGTLPIPQPSGTMNVVPLRPVPPPADATPADKPDAELAPADARVTLPVGKWARYAGTLGAGLTVSVSAAVIRRQGYEPNQPDDGDVELFREALEEGLRMRFGDSAVPWWLGAAIAAGGIYGGMRIGAERRPGTEPQAPKLDIVPPQPSGPKAAPTIGAAPPIRPTR